MAEWQEPTLQSAEGKLWHTAFSAPDDDEVEAFYVAVGELEDCRPVYRAVGGLEDPRRFEPVEGWTYPSLLKWLYGGAEVLSKGRELSERSLRRRYPAAWPPPAPAPGVAQIIEDVAEARRVTLRRRLR